MDPAAQVEKLVDPLVAAEGLELVDVSFSGGALQVFVDRPGGVDLETLSETARRVSVLLDESDPLPGAYTLEVSSPGLERPLRRPAHFERFVGTEIKLKTRASVAGERREQGRLQSADDEGIVINDRRLSYGEIDQARTVFEWGTVPGGPRR